MCKIYFVFITSRKLTEHYRNLQENIETTNVTSVGLHREVKCRLQTFHLHTVTLP